MFAKGPVLHAHQKITEKMRQSLYTALASRCRARQSPEQLRATANQQTTGSGGLQLYSTGFLFSSAPPGPKCVWNLQTPLPVYHPARAPLGNKHSSRDNKRDTASLYRWSTKKQGCSGPPASRYSPRANARCWFKASGYGLAALRRRFPRPAVAFRICNPTVRTGNS